MIQFMNVEDARKQFSRLCNRIARRKDRAVLIRDDRKMAALIPFEDLEQLQTWEGRMDLAAAR